MYKAKYNLLLLCQESKSIHNSRKELINVLPVVVDIITP